MQILAAASDAHRLRVEKKQIEVARGIVARQIVSNLLFTSFDDKKQKKRLARKDKPFLFCCIVPKNLIRIGKSGTFFLLSRYNSTCITSLLR